MTPKGLLGGGNCYRSSVTVSLVGADSGSGMASIEYHLDGQEWVKTNKVVITADGDHGLERRVTNKAGNVTHRGIAVHIDTIPPVATFIIMPAAGSTTHIQEVIMLGGRVSDIGSGVASVEISLDDGKTWQILQLVNEIRRYNWNTTWTPNGSCPVVARARDIAGNVQTLGTTVTIIAANNPPFVKVLDCWNIRMLGHFPCMRIAGFHASSTRKYYWNFRFANKILAPPLRKYEVVVEARDIDGNKASDKGLSIVIALFENIQSSYRWIFNQHSKFT